MDTTHCPYCFSFTPKIPCSNCGWQTSQDNPPPALPLGQVLDGRYRIGRVLGHGGFGITYLAWDENLQLRLAIKEYLPRDCASRAADGVNLTVYSGQALEQFAYGLDRFLEEARALAHFDQHPGIVTVKNFFSANGTGYCVMDYVEGVTLQEFLEHQPGGRITFDAAFKLLMPVMDALRAVHKEGLLHRDISPDNIYLTQEGRVRLLDFGAARFAAGEHSKSLSIILKPGYAPEEQYRTKGRQGSWTDVYGLAATFYKAITGLIPPSSIDRLDTDELLPPSKLGLTITEEQEAVLLKALAIKADKRFSNIVGFQDALLDVDKKKDQSRSNKEVVNDLIPPDTVGSSAATSGNSIEIVREKPKANAALVMVIIFLVGVGVWALYSFRINSYTQDQQVAINSINQENIHQQEEESGAQEEVSSLPTLNDGKAAYDRGDYANALDIFRRLAEENNAEAQYSLGAMYLLGKGTPVNEPEGFRWYEKSAKQDYAVAQLELGLLYSLGKGVTLDHAKAHEWYLKAANQKLAGAQYAIGLQYFLGNGVNQNDSLAADWYRKAADQGFADAQHGLGFLYANGRGVKKDYAEAVKWYRLAAEQNHPEGQHKLGLMYTLAQGVPKDNEKAAKWFRKAAEQGHGYAQYFLGHLYLTGDGVPKNDEQALKWFSKSASQDNTDAQFALGNMHLSGQGVTQNYQEALNWFQKVADKGDPNGQYMVAGFHEEGLGISKNLKKAFGWYQKAADQGHAMSQVRLGAMYQFGIGVKVKHSDAAKWYRKAAEQGLDEAQFNLGVAYLNGTGVKKDSSEAVAWFRKAADQGHAPAQYNMGIAYLNGGGIAKNKNEGIKWLQKAADKGLQEARDLLDQIN